MASGFRVSVDFEIEDVGVVGWVMWDGFGDTTEVQHVEIPTEFYLRLPGDRDQPALLIKYEVRDGQPVCASIQINAKPQGREVIPKDLDEIHRALSEWTRGAVITVLQHSETMTPIASDHQAIEDRAHATYTAITKTPKRRKITDALLAQVAGIYRDNIDNKPWSAIKSHYNVSDATAGRYVMLARRAGYLPPTDSGKKKA